MTLEDLKEVCSPNIQVELFDEFNVVYKGKISEFHFCSDYGYEINAINQKLRFADDKIYQALVVNMKKVD